MAIESAIVEYIAKMLPFAQQYQSLQLIIAAALVGLVILAIVVIFDYSFGWIERKLIARVHLRRGPTKVGLFGILQNAADVTKLLSKENIVPANANKVIMLSGIFLFAFLLMLAVQMLNMSSVFFSFSFSIAVLAVFAILSLLPILVFIVGWSTGNKFASISAQRSVILLVSFELSLLLAVAAVGFASGSFDFQGIVAAQANLPFAILMPIGFVVFFIAMLAEMERSPFDIREADSELVAGWLTDMSAPMYVVMLFVDYTRMFLGCSLIALLFLGGWNGPLLPGIVWFMIKVALLAAFIIVIRASTPRMRLDQALRFGWSVLLPLAIINLFWAYLLVNGII